MGVEIPGYLGFVIGGAIFCLAGLAYGAIILYAWRESRRMDQIDQRPGSPGLDPDPSHGSNQQPNGSPAGPPSGSEGSARPT